MRIAYVCLDPGVPVFGNKGCSIHCQEIMRVFQKRGFEIEVFASRFGPQPPVGFRPIRLRECVGALPKDPGSRELALMEQNTTVEQLLEDSQPFDLIYERFSLWSFAAMEWAKKNGIPAVLEVNSPLIEEQKKYRSLVNEKLARSLIEKCFRNATSLIAVSREVADAIQTSPSIKQKTAVVPNGVNLNRFSIPPKVSHSPKKVIGFVGTLKPWHGVSVLLEAFAKAHSRNSQLECKIVGSGPEQENLLNQVSGYSDEVQNSIEWTGAVAPAEIPNLLASFDIAVAPYPAIAGFYFSPLKILEYMAAGRAMVASDIGQISQLITHKATGLLTRPGCSDQLSEALLELCDDDALRFRIGQAAQNVAREQHSWDRVVDQTLATLPSSCPPCEVI